MNATMQQVIELIEDGYAKLEAASNEQCICGHNDGECRACTDWISGYRKLEKAKALLTSSLEVDE